MTELEALLGKQWTKRDGSVDERMVTYCLKSSKYIDLGPYYLNIGSAKPSIERTVYYDDETPRPDVTRFDVWKAYNMRGKRLDWDEVTADGRTQIYTYINSSVDKTGGKIRGWTAARRGDELNHLIRHDLREATADDIAAIKQGLAEIKADYEKRLNAYWKRYQDKIRTHGYWADR